MDIYYIKNKNDFDCYATLDVIGDPIATDKNTIKMEKKGLNPIPVFHFKSDINYLKKLIKKYNYIALGGLVPIARRRNILDKWLNYCFSYIKNNCKIHGFGINSIWA